MSCAARYSETTSLEFILNPFKFFFTDYVMKIVPCCPSCNPHLETQIRSPTIFRSSRTHPALTHNDCRTALLPLQHLCSPC
ncbi:hypothetical protein A8H39_08595 [Paraburkholderia fungorum]|nr:hypothetical protein A8H39_08595 [Paraburkholderia fungorum]PZR46223.1 MAG: hypothetical protein DI523_18130 [Paraburkholderia fungorum]